MQFLNRLSIISLSTLVLACSSSDEACEVGPDCGDSTAGMTCVPGGAFLAGVAERELCISAFEIDVTEVTTADYLACVTAGSCSTSTENNTSCNIVESRLDHPVNCVTWDQAVSYCAFVGKRLPTEAEWEKAARGPDGRIYPWGDDDPTCQRAVMEEGDGEGNGGGPGCDLGTTAPVGSRSPAGDSPFQVQNMAGNVAEFVSDFAGGTYPESADPLDPQGPATGVNRVLRGGSYSGEGGVAGGAFTTFARSEVGPQNVLFDAGFRCAR